MAKFELLMLLWQATIVLWVGAIGASVGSLINVLVYRLPLGLSVISPPSRCPSCGTKLGWRDNIPVLGWVVLRGKCRYCSNKISFEYPLIELIVGLLFAGLFLLWYVVPTDAAVLGIQIGQIRPEWALWDTNGRSLLPMNTWPEFLVLVTLMGSLVAMTLIDARTFTIPLILTWIPTIAAVLLYTAHALVIQLQGGDGLRFHALRQPWAIPIPWTKDQAGAPNAMLGWWWIGASLAAMVGLAVSLVLLKLGVLKQSFADYDEWEQQVLAEANEKRALEQQSSDEPGEDADTGPHDSSEEAEEELVGDNPELWIQYPHARREMFRELLFLGPAIALGLLGGLIATRLSGPWELDPSLGILVNGNMEAPLWLRVLAGVLMGYLIGGAVVWGVRIFGTIAFGKEAMGLGDVHLLAAIGACLGWIDAVLTFFGACFVGAAWGVLGMVFKGKLAKALPFGPYLAVAALLVVLCKPLIEVGLARMFHVEMIDLP